MDQQDYQIRFCRMVKSSSPPTMDPGARAFGEGVLDQRQTRHPSSYNSDYDRQIEIKRTNEIELALFLMQRLRLRGE